MLCRISCTLNPKQLKFFEIYRETIKNGEEIVIEPEYIKIENLQLKFKPSSNISSGQICPILVSAQHFNELSSPQSRLIIPALWGLIPRWHKGNFREHEFNTSNFRVENNVNESRMYKPAFSRGRRCAMICEGYYEWMRNPSNLPVDERPIYFIRPHPRSREKSSSSSLMHIAGIFDVWNDDEGNSIHSFTILSIESSEKLNWLHPRMPVILDTDEQVRDWLNFTQISDENALKLINKSRNVFHTRMNAKNILFERNDRR